MMKHLSLTWLFWRTSIAAESEYRFNFVLALLTVLGTFAGGLFAMTLFFQNGRSFSGWSFDESLVVLGSFTLLSGVSASLFVPNLNEIVNQVDKGTLDYVLLKPVDPQFWLSFRQFSLLGIPDVLLGLGLCFYGARGSLSFDGIIFWAVAQFLACIIFYSLWFILASTTLWFVKIYNITEVLRALLDAGRLPDAAFPASFQFFFKFVVPIFCLTTLPAEMLSQKANAISLLYPLGLSIFFMIVSRGVWNQARRSYTSASS